MIHKLESRLQGEISIMQMTPPKWQKGRGIKEPLDEGERGEWKSWHKTQLTKNKNHGIWSHLVQFSSVQSLSRVWLFATPYTAAHQASLSISNSRSLPTHVHWVSDDIQPSHPLSTPSPASFNLSQHHGLFKWVSSSHQVAKVLKFQVQHQSFQWIFRTDFH